MQKEVENMIEDYGVPIENLIGCANNSWDSEKPETEAFAFLNNGECDEVEETIKDIEEVFLWFVNNCN